MCVDGATRSCEKSPWNPQFGVKGKEQAKD